MKHKSLLIVMALVMCVALAGTVVAQGNKPDAVEAAITTKFTHQGQIKRNGILYNGTCDMRFTLWDAGTAGAQLATYIPPTQIPVSDGVFTVEVDFGASFTGQTRWLQAEAKCADDAGYTNLPRVALNAVPYAMSLVPGAVISTTGALGLTVRAPNGNPIVAYGGANGYAAVYGSDTSATGGYGLYGLSVKGTGVYGQSTSVGVWGKSTSAVGVYGTSDTYAGVWGESANDEGVRGVSHNASHGGVVGINDAVGGIAVYGIAPNGGYAAWFNGRTKTKVVEITGGADLAELFRVSEDKTEPGTLLIIDAANPGQLTISTNAYDTKVAGIVSGAGNVKPGLTLHQEGVMEGDTEVAIAGRVYVKAIGSNGSIKPGDLLTTSDRPGYAMKATDPDRSHGAVIGKAMTALDHGEGLVLVLVNLQ